jgi:hypothetical protein
VGNSMAGELYRRAGGQEGRRKPIVFLLIS